MMEAAHSSAMGALQVDGALGQKQRHGQVDQQEVDQWHKHGHEQGLVQEKEQS